MTRGWTIERGATLHLHTKHVPSAMAVGGFVRLTSVLPTPEQWADWQRRALDCLRDTLDPYDLKSSDGELRVSDVEWQVLRTY